MSDTHNKLQYGNKYFSFSNCNTNHTPTHLPKHQFLNPNHQFSQCILYVEFCSVHAHMAWSQKFRKSEISLDTSDSASSAVVKRSVLFLLTSVLQNAFVCILWTSCLRAKYCTLWPFAKKLYHGEKVVPRLSTMTSLNEISWKLPPPQNEELVAPLPSAPPGKNPSDAHDPKDIA